MTNLFEGEVENADRFAHSFFSKVAAPLEPADLWHSHGYLLRQVGLEEGEDALVGDLGDVGGEKVALAGVDLDFAGEIS